MKATVATPRSAWQEARLVSAGRLVRLFEIGLPDPNAYWLLSHADRADEARIRAFSNWIRRESAAMRIDAG